MINILYSKQAKKQIQLMNKKTAIRITAGINNLPNGDIKPLQGKNTPPMFRLRIGKYRIIYITDNQNYKILKIDVRSDVYKDL